MLCNVLGYIVLVLKTVDENLRLGQKLTINKKSITYRLLTHEVVILTKFLQIMTKNTDFLSMVIFKPCRKFSSTISITKVIESNHETCYNLCLFHLQNEKSLLKNVELFSVMNSWFVEYGLLLKKKP